MTPQLRPASRLLALPLALAAAFAATPASAQSLQELYESARTYDAAWQSARANYEATQYRAEQAMAGLLPGASFTASDSKTRLEVPQASPPTDRRFEARSNAIQASQPLYRPANLVTYRQGQRQVELAQAQLTAVTQDLIVRVSQAYFDVLSAQDTLAFTRAQKAAIAEQLASAKRNFEVGTATITDTREAQAKYDLVVAQELAAENDLRVKKLALETVTGRKGATPVPLATPVAVPTLPAEDIDKWVNQAEDLSPAIAQSRVNLDVARLEIDKAKAGHKPTLDATASRTFSQNINGTTTTVATTRPVVTSVGLTLTVPLFAGFATQNRVRETLSLEEKAQADLEKARRDTTQAVRTAFFGVVSGASQVKALEAAESSSQVALDANRLGYQVGVRINIDVLNAQSQLFQTKRDLAVARYNVLLGGLKLRQANGSLQPQDLNAVNGLLAKP